MSGARQPQLDGAPAPQPGSIVDSYSLTAMQQGMLFEWLSDPTAGVNLEQITCTLDAIDVARFVTAWRELAARHVMLRTTFRWRDAPDPMQDVWDRVSLSVVEEDLRELSANRQHARIDAYLADDRRAGFDLATPPLFRLAFFRVGEDRHEFVWTFPHILADGRSFVLLIRELIDIYRAHEEGRTPDVPERRPFRDFVTWLESRDHAAAKEHFRRALSGFSEPVVLDLGPADPFSGAEYVDQSLRLSLETTNALRAVAARHDVTLNTMVQGAWALLLARYAGVDDIVFGATRAARRTALDGDPSANGIAGIFINTLPVRVRVRASQPVIEWLQQIRQDQVDVREAEHIPLALVQAVSNVAAGARLFESIVVFENEQQSAAFDAIDSRFSNFRLLERMTFPVSLHAYGERELLLRIEYYRSRFDDAAVRRMLGHLDMLLTEMVQRLDQPIGSLEIMSGPEQQLVLRDWNATDTPFPLDATLAELIAEQAARSPDAEALLFEGQSLTYRELAARAHTLARALAGLGVGPGVLVGVCMERSFELVVSLVAILQAGGAYVPLDPEYPPDRLAFMIEDAGCTVLLTQARVADTVLRELAGGKSVTLCVDRDWERIVADATDAPTPTRAGPDDLAYMIYTSGSTGRPKGALNRHRGIVNRLLWMQSTYRLSPDDTVLQKTPASFDVSVWEFFWPLIAGARLALAKPGGHRDPAYLASLIDAAHVSVMHFVPSMLRVFLDAAVSGTGASLRDVMCSGEALPFELQQRFFARFAHARLHNLYGPTEAAVDVTWWPCVRDDPRAIVPIGRAIANTRIYVLDPSMKPVPVGVQGELYLGGVQVGAGYHRRPELTAERFVSDPFDSDPAARLYRTGDRVRWLSDGVVEYLGRFDFQIKLRGFRIEVGEIEAALETHPDVREAVVVLRMDPGIEPRLVAYCVPASAPLEASALRDHLEHTLPSHMVPALFVPLAAMPLSPSGKLDRKALPAPETAISRGTSVAPRDDIEARVMRIWADVLGLQNFGVTDRFNEIGGHSLAAVRVFMRIVSEFGTQLQLVTMLKHDTVEKLANLLRDGAKPPEWRCIQALNATGVGVPIFCPHAQTGNVLIYQHLARELAPYHTVYALEARGNWGTQEPHESVEEMADYYVEEILKVQPQGPYLLFALSLGGWIALEIGRRLLAQGRDVRFLAMYDTVGRDYPRYTLRGKIVKIALENGGIPLWRLRAVFKVGPITPFTPSHLAQFARSLLRNGRDTMRWWMEKIHRDWLAWRFAHRNPPHGFPLPANTTRVRLASRRIEQRYRLSFYPGKLTYFRAKYQRTGTHFDPTNGWAGLAAELEVHEVVASHTDALGVRRVGGFAKMLKACLDHALAPSDIDRSQHGQSS